MGKILCAVLLFVFSLNLSSADLGYRERASEVDNYQRYKDRVKSIAFRDPLRFLVVIYFSPIFLSGAGEIKYADWRLKSRLEEMANILDYAGGVHTEKNQKYFKKFYGKFKSGFWQSEEELMEYLLKLRESGMLSHYPLAKDILKALKKKDPEYLPSMYLEDHDDDSIETLLLDAEDIECPICMEDGPLGFVCQVCQKHTCAPCLINHKKIKKYKHMSNTVCPRCRGKDGWAMVRVKQSDT